MDSNKVIDEDIFFEKLKSMVFQIKEKCEQHQFLQDLPFYADALIAEKRVNEIQNDDALEHPYNQIIVRHLSEVITKTHDTVTDLINKENQKKPFVQEDNFQEIKSQATKLIEMKHEIENLKISITNDLRSFFQLDSNCEELQMEIFALKPDQNLPILVMTKIEAQQLSRWYSKFLRVNEFLTQHKVQVINNSTLAFEFTNPANAPERIPTLTLTNTFSRKENGLITTEPNVNIESLDIHEDFHHNDTMGLIKSIYQKWTEHIPVLHEVMKLRERYAADWISEQSILRVMFGQAGQIICTLFIPKNYPNDKAVILQKIDGLSSDYNIKRYQLPGNHSLTEWLDHLDNQFN